MLADVDRAAPALPRPARDPWLDDVFAGPMAGAPSAKSDIWPTRAARCDRYHL